MLLFKIEGKTEDEIVDFSRCVGCFNCFDVCPSIGISYIPRYPASKTKKISSGNKIYACIGPCIGKKSYEVDENFFKIIDEL